MTPLRARGTLTVMQPSMHAHLATFADLEAWDKGYEVVDGQLVRKASPSFEHGGAQASIVRAQAAFHGRRGLGGGWWIHTEVDVELAPHQIYLPDVAGWRIDVVPERPRGRPVRIPPQWACEVLSASTADRDLGAKLRGYHQAGVGYYWLVDTERQELRVLRRHDHGYRLMLAAGPGELVRAEPFEILELDTGELFGE